MSTQNPCNADNWFNPQVHPCKGQFEQIKTNKRDKNYKDIHNIPQHIVWVKKAMKINFPVGLISLRNAVIRHRT